MKAAVLREVNTPMTIERVDVDEPRGLEVLIRSTAAGLCHSDLLFMTGDWPHALPTILGHEVAGVVEAVGPGVTYLKPGDHVIGCAGGPCYHCRWCVVGRPIICEHREHDRAAGEPPRLSHDGESIHQYGQLSAFAEQMLVHENATVRIDEDVPLELASIVGCGVATGLGAVFNTARVAPGESVVVVGCGGVGLNAVQGARIAGAGPIVAVDVVPGKLELALRLGATHTVNGADADAAEQVRELTRGGAAHVVECSGVVAAEQQAIELLGPAGTLTLVGIPAQGATVSFEPAALIPFEKRIQGSHVGSLRPRVDLPRYLDMYRRGQLDLETLVSARIPLEQVNEGFAAMGRGDVARSIVTF